MNRHINRDQSIEKSGDNIMPGGKNDIKIIIDCTMSYIHSTEYDGNCSRILWYTHNNMPNC